MCADHGITDLSILKQFRLPNDGEEGFWITMEEFLSDSGAPIEGFSIWITTTDTIPSEAKNNFYSRASWTHEIFEMITLHLLAMDFR